MVGLQQPPTLDNNVALLMMLQFVDEIGEAFGDAHERVEADDAALRPTRAPRIPWRFVGFQQLAQCASAVDTLPVIHLKYRWY